MYAHNFKTKGYPLHLRNGRGMPFYAWNIDGQLCYAVVCGDTQLHGQEGHDRDYTAFDKLGNMELWADVKAGRVVVGEGRKQGPSNPRAKDADDIKGGQKIGGGPKDEAGYKGIVALSSDEEEDGGEMSVEDVIVRHVSAFDQIANKGLKIAKDALQAAKKLRDTEGQAVYQNLKVEFGDLRSELAAARSDLGSELMARVSEQNKW